MKPKTVVKKVRSVHIHFLLIAGVWLGISSCAPKEDLVPEISVSQIEMHSDSFSSEKIEALIVRYREILDASMNEVIGHNALRMSNEGKHESSLGKFVSKLMLEQSKKVYETHVDVALINHHGGLRAPIAAGDITLGNIYEVMPFENEVLLLELSGVELQQLIEFVSTEYSSMMWPVSYELEQGEMEKHAINILISGESIQLEKKYILAVTDYQANGGNEFHLLSTAPRLPITPIKLRDMILLEVRQSQQSQDTIHIETPHSITLLP